MKPLIVMDIKAIADSSITEDPVIADLISPENAAAFVSIPLASPVADKAIEKANVILV